MTTRKRLVLAASATAGLAVAAAAIGNAAHLRLLTPTGAAAVGRTTVSWVDRSRIDARRGGFREVPVVIWYPAVRGTGRPAPYIRDLKKLGGALVASGEVNRLEAASLRFVRGPAREDATIRSTGRRLPLVILSPGNLTNVSFYASLAEELASRGYVVVGIDHPYSVAAVELRDGTVAVGRGTVPPSGIADEMRRRVADIRFVLGRVQARDPKLSFLAGRLDLARVGVMGHSLGGLAAVEACKADARVRACLNIDGQGAGGPFSTRPDGTPPKQPFMFLTKESTIHPALVERFESAGRGAFRVVVPAASHGSFTDGGLFEPSVLPWWRTADKVMRTARSMTLAFFDHTLRGAPTTRLGRVDAQTDVFVSVFPLRGRPPLPTRT